MGAVTPLGNDVATFWDALVAGRSGVRTIDTFDPSRVSSRMATHSHQAGRCLFWGLPDHSAASSASRSSARPLAVSFCLRASHSRREGTRKSCVN